MINNLKNYFFPESMITNSLEKVFFEYDLFSINSRRILTSSLVLMIGFFILVFFDIYRYYQGTMDQFAYELAKIHIAFFLMLIIFYISTKFVVRHVKNNLFNRMYFFLFSSVVMAILIWNTLIDQLANGQITVLIMGFFGISILLFLYPLDAFILYLISTIAFFWLLPEFQKNVRVITSHYINVPFLTLLSFFISYTFFKNKVQDFLKSKKLEEVNSELDELINKILPSNISYELRKNNVVKPTLHEDATVVFVDFVGFSKIVNHTDINLVITILENLFSEFDLLVKKFGLEKIKTIGDGYMFVGGLFGDKENHIEKCIDCSLDIIELINKKGHELKNITGFEWNVRIGIDTGSVISGVIGNWRFLFDIWGNTVNIASRLETTSGPGCVNISKNVYGQIKNNQKYTFEARGLVPIKNIGNIEMYYVSRVKERIEI